MSGRRKVAARSNDPQPYIGPITRADGMRPYNRYLWPLDEDWYWANRQFGNSVDSYFNFSVVALADGRWSTSGFVWDIEEGKCVHESREKALRASVALFIRTCRNARRWPGRDRLSEERCQQIIAWAFEIVGRQARKPFPLSAPAAPRPTSLLDIMERAA